MREQFQSTPLIRGETSRRRGRNSFGRFQSTPLIRGETPSGIEPLFDGLRFQSTPLIRGETSSSVSFPSMGDFNPLPSYEGRLDVLLWHLSCIRISIHSPHTRGDAQGRDLQGGRRISIHSPHTRGDFSASKILRAMIAFQSTPLIRGETMWVWGKFSSGRISIHSPHTRGDHFLIFHNNLVHNFNPLPSHEGRPVG